MLKGRSIESTTFSIINRYLRFADKVEGKRRTNWPLNEQWGRFIGRNRKEIQLTSEPKPYTIERTLNWLGRQVAPTWKMAKELDRLNQTTISRIWYRMRAYQTGIKDFGTTKYGNRKLDYMKRGIVVGSVKDMLLAFGGKDA